MRFLFTLQPLTGHFHSMAPVALALRDAGHDVAFATGERYLDTLHRAGFQSFACGLDYTEAESGLTSLPQWPKIVARFENPALQQLAGFIEGMAPRMADDLAPIVRNWRPNLIVRDPVEFGGYIAAERAGLKHASITWGLYIDARALCPASLQWLRNRCGLPSQPALDSLDRSLVMKFLPRSWHPPGILDPDATRCFCAPPYDNSGAAALPHWVHSLPDLPTVCATLGTTFNRAPAVFRAIIEALADEPLNVILTVGRTMDPHQFDPLPPNTHVEQYIPQSLILPRCQALIFHGGYNSLLSGLWHGLPLVVIPQEAGDQWPTALRCVAEGVGIHLEGAPPPADAIREAVRAVLTDTRYRARSQEVARQIRELPPLTEAVHALEALASA